MKISDHIFELTGKAKKPVKSLSKLMHNARGPTVGERKILVGVVFYGPVCDTSMGQETKTKPRKKVTKNTKNCLYGVQRLPNYFYGSCASHLRNCANFLNDKTKNRNREEDQ